MPIIDFHAHILPGADHGSDCSRTSLAQLALLRTAGVDAVVATPHFYPHYHSVDAFRARRAHAAERLARHLTVAHPTVFVGSEVLACEGLENMEGLAHLAVKGTRTILLELPFSGWGHGLVETVLQIREQGFTPVLAHIDRYPRARIEEFLHEGIHAQLNAEIFAHPLRLRAYRRWIEDGSVVALGSDIHEIPKNGHRPFQKMCAKLGERADLIFARTAELLEGATPLVPAEAPQKEEALVT